MTVVLFCAVVGVVAVTAGKRGDSGHADSIELGNLLVGQELFHTLRVRVPGGRSVADLATLHSTCGCAALMAWRPAIGDGGSLEITIRSWVGAYDEYAGADLVFSFADGHTERVPIGSTVVPPFDGWPAHATARSHDGALMVPIDARYSEHIGSVRAYDVSANELNCEFDPTRGLFRTYAPGDEPGWTAELIVDFKTDGSPLRWAGPIAVVPGSH